MKKYLIAIIASMVVAPNAIAQKSKAAGASYPISPVPFTSVKVTPGTFWGPWGGCRVPKSWTISYRDDQGNWKPVEPPDQYGVEKGVGNTVNFKAVKTKALRLEVTLPDDNSAGLFEWSVK